MNISKVYEVINAGGNILENLKAKATELELKVVSPVPEDIDVATAEDGLYDDTLLYSNAPYNLKSEEDSDTQYGLNTLKRTLMSVNGFDSQAVVIKENEESNDEPQEVSRFENISKVPLHDFLKKFC